MGTGEHRIGASSSSSSSLGRFAFDRNGSTKTHCVGCVAATGAEETERKAMTPTNACAIQYGRCWKSAFARKHTIFKHREGPGFCTLNDFQIPISCKYLKAKFVTLVLFRIRNNLESSLGSDFLVP